MARIGPMSRRALIANLRRLGFDGPFPGGRHEIITRGRDHAILPNPLQGDIHGPFLARLLSQGGISRDEWDAL